MSRAPSPSYVERLRSLSKVWWKRVLRVQLPYRLNPEARTSAAPSVGCGIGRNLRSLTADSLGVDHNSHSVALAKAAGLKAMTTGGFLAGDAMRPAAFDSLLVAHATGESSAPARISA